MSKYNVDYSRLPDYMRDGAERYIENRIEPGSFMLAVLENRFVEAVGRADSTNLHCLQDWALWLYNDCPSKAWGSPAKVAAWLKGEGA